MRTGRSLLHFGIPYLAGLAVAHSFIPPTRGPVAVADILGADLGWMILLGVVTGLPTAILAGPVFGRAIARRIAIIPPASPPAESDRAAGTAPPTSRRQSALIFATPLGLILANTASQTMVKRGVLAESAWTRAAAFAEHPFTTLLVATLLALWLLGIRRGVGREDLMRLSTRALGPAGLVIPITGAGGMLKQALVGNCAGAALADLMVRGRLPPVALAWLLAAIVRVAQGSSTVAMITAACMVAPMLRGIDLSDARRALIVISIASGATILSHVNDSGFWLVGKYFGLT